MMAGTMLARRLVWMGAVGGTATLTYAALTWFLASVASLPAALASLPSYAVAACVSYCGHRYLTFGSRRPHREAVSPFVALSVCGYALAFAIPGFFSGVLDAPIGLSILLTCIVVPLMNYLVMSHLVFPHDALGGH